MFIGGLLEVLFGLGRVVCGGDGYPWAVEQSKLVQMMEIKS